MPFTTVTRQRTGRLSTGTHLGVKAFLTVRRSLFAPFRKATHDLGKKSIACVGQYRTVFQKTNCCNLYNVDQPIVDHDFPSQNFDFGGSSTNVWMYIIIRGRRLNLLIKIRILIGQIQSIYNRIRLFRLQRRLASSFSETCVITL